MRKEPDALENVADAAAQLDRIGLANVAVADQDAAGRRLNEAIVFYNNALRLLPTWPEGWWYLGSIFYDRDRYREAREALGNLLSVQPKNGPAWALMGLCATSVVRLGRR